jgi:CubicO group peptidase (beta-lactamase class C family)
MNMKRIISVVGLAALATSLSAQTTAPVTPAVSRPPAIWTVPANSYFPDAGNAWERRRPSQVGLDSAKLAAAVAFAVASESRSNRDLEIAHYQTFGREPFGNAVGAFKTRGPATGMIVRGGYIVAEWGEPDRVDMTFSVTKSFLSTVVGLAVDRGLIRDVNDTISKVMAPILVANNPVLGLGADAPGEGRWIRPFDGAHNSRLTWDHMLRQVSDWEGTLWGKPDWADRPGQPNTWFTRARVEPGSTYEYNDVRVNALALAALNVWRRPLPQVLREHVMDPIGASPTWRWFGYDNSWVVLDGQLVQAVGGGGHWGGGMFIGARDMARFGLLTLRRGQWKDKRVLSEKWVSQALTPTPAQPTYGYMNWFLNTDRKQYASAPAKAFVHVGNGTNIIYVDPDNDIVAVVRWIENNQVDAFIQRMLESVQGPMPATRTR